MAFTLLARATVPKGTPANSQENGAGVAGVNVPNDQAASPSASLQEILAHPDIIPTHHHPLLGQQAPDFELADHEGKVRNLIALLDGRPAVLIFYHGYHCPGCVRQLLDFKKDLALFNEVGGG